MNAVDSLARRQYINLETFRKNGKSVKTPVWFVQDQDLIYVQTIANSGKVKRIRSNQQVNIAPCKVDGTVIGDWSSANAVETKDEATYKRVNRLLLKKYGLLKLLFGISAKMQGANHTILEIRANT